MKMSTIAIKAYIVRIITPMSTHSISIDQKSPNPKV